MIRQDLTRAGFVINEEKSDFEPRQRVTWLGFSLDLNQGNISVPEQRTTEKSNGKASPSMTGRQLANIVGQIVGASVSELPSSDANGTFFYNLNIYMYIYMCVSYVVPHILNLSNLTYVTPIKYV